jgi:hypothetical protein
MTVSHRRNPVEPGELLGSYVRADEWGDALLHDLDSGQLTELLSRGQWSPRPTPRRPDATTTRRSASTSARLRTSCTAEASGKRSNPRSRPVPPRHRLADSAVLRQD